MFSRQALGSRAKQPPNDNVTFKSLSDMAEAAPMQRDRVVSGVGVVGDDNNYQVDGADELR